MREHIETCLTRLLFLARPILVCSCSPAEPPSATTIEARPERDDNLVPTGDLMDEQIAFQFAIFYLPQPATEPLAELDSLLNDEFPGIRRVEVIEGPQQSPVLAARMVSDAKQEYTPPDLGLLQYGRGLSQAEAEALQDSEAVLILDWALGRNDQGSLHSGSLEGAADRWLDGGESGRNEAHRRSCLQEGRVRASDHARNGEIRTSRCRDRQFLLVAQPQHGPRR